MKVALKLLFSIALLYFIIQQIDIKRVIDALSSVNIFYFFLAFLLYNLSKIISAIRLNYYFKEIAINLPLWQNLRLYYLGMFYNLFLPGGIGGDGYKAYILKRHFGCKLTLVLKALLFDRISGLIALLFLAALLFLFSRYAISPLNYLALLTAVAIYPLFYFISYKKQLFMRYFQVTNTLGFLVQFVQLLSALALLFALDSSLPIVEYLVLFLISSVVSVLPITIGGVGVRELTFLYGLQFIGLAPDSGIAFSFLFFALNLFASALGVFFITSAKNLPKVQQNVN